MSKRDYENSILMKNHVSTERLQIEMSFLVRTKVQSLRSSDHDSRGLSKYPDSLSLFQMKIMAKNSPHFYIHFKFFVIQCQRFVIF